MSDEQKTIETYFKEHEVIDPSIKIKILPDITDLVYERNNALVKAQRREHQDIKEGLIREARETDQKIHDIITDALNRLTKK